LEGIGGGKIGMDCSIVPMKRHGLSMISTCDFFYPLVDDPYLQGRIGACNVLSDMYALGVVQIDSVLMILAASNRMEQETRDIVTRQMIEGFEFTCKAAGVDCTGGQSVVNPWPIIGGTAMSACARDEFIMPTGAVVGDVLILTKGLGTQVVANLNEWRQLEDKTNWNKAMEVITPEDAKLCYEIATEGMSRLNRNGAILMHKYKAHACTDVTGFGILGHAANLAQNQEARVDFEIDTLPLIHKVEVVAKHLNKFRITQGYSAETSGGLLIAISEENAQDFIKEIQELDQKPAWIIGRVVTAQDSTKNQARIVENFNIIRVSK
jgi:selenide,water dikinase